MVLAKNVFFAVPSILKISKNNNLVDGAELVNVANSGDFSTLTNIENRNLDSNLRIF